MIDARGWEAVDVTIDTIDCVDYDGGVVGSRLGWYVAGRRRGLIFEPRLVPPVWGIPRPLDCHEARF